MTTEDTSTPQEHVPHDVSKKPDEGCPVTEQTASTWGTSEAAESSWLRDASEIAANTAAESSLETDRIRSDQDMRAKPHVENPGTNLFISQLACAVTESMLTGLFSKYGRVEAATVMRDPHTQESRGFGFVKMGDADEAEKTMEVLNGFEFEGRSLMVQKARRGRPRTPTPGRYYGETRDRPRPRRDVGYSGSHRAGGSNDYDRYEHPPQRSSTSRYEPRGDYGRGGDRYEARRGSDFEGSHHDYRGSNRYDSRRSGSFGGGMRALARYDDRPPRGGPAPALRNRYDGDSRKPRDRSPY